MIYEPAEDSFLLAEQIKFFAKNKKILDMGTGSGILAKKAHQVRPGRLDYQTHDFCYPGN